MLFFIRHLLLLAVLFESMLLVHAQETLSPEVVAELTRRSRAPELPLKAKEKIVKTVAKYIQQELAKNPKLIQKNPEEVKEFFKDNERALDQLGLEKSDPLRTVISEFTQLINSIKVTENLKKCETRKKDIVSDITVKTGEDYSICDQGRVVEEFVVFGKTGDLQRTTPGFFYFDQLKDLSSIKNIAQISALKVNKDPSPQLGNSFEDIKAQNRDIEIKKAPVDPIQVAWGIELRAEAYQRAIVNPFKNIAMLRVLYANPGLDLKDIRDLKDEVEANCQKCSTKQVENILTEVETGLTRDIRLNHKTKMNELQITKSICQKLSSRGYKPEWKNEFNSYASDKKVLRDFDPKTGQFRQDTVPNDVPKLGSIIKRPDSSKIERSIQQQTNEANAILGSIGDGWEGLLLMTPDLTSKDKNNSPTRVALDCLNVENEKNAELIRGAVISARHASLQYVREDLNKTIDFTKIQASEVMEQLSSLMETNKRAFGEALVKNPHLVPVACNAINFFSNSDRKETNSLLLTWGVMITSATLELTGVLAPMGAWMQGAVIATETVGTVAMSKDMYDKAHDLDVEADKELLSGLAQGGDGGLILSSMAKRKSADDSRSAAELLAAFSALNSLRFLKIKQAEAHLFSGNNSIHETADDIIVNNNKIKMAGIEVKEINDAVYKQTLSTVEESGSVGKIESVLGKKDAQKLNQYIDALLPDERVKLLNGLETNQAKTLDSLSKIPCFSKKASTKCLDEIQDTIKNSFPDIRLNLKPLSDKIGSLPQDIVDSLETSHFSQMEINNLAKNLSKKDLDPQMVDTMRDYLEFISNRPLNKRMAAIKDIKLLVNQSKTPSPLFKEFKKFQQEALKKEEQYLAQEIKKLKKDNTIPENQIDVTARETAKDKKLAWQRQAGACRSSIPSTYTNDGIKKFIKFQKIASPSYTVLSYVLANLEKEKDTLWFKKLGWATIMSTISGHVPGIILKNRMDSRLASTVKEMLVGLGVTYADAQLYTIAMSDKKPKKDANDPETKKAMLTMAQKVYEIMESDEFKTLMKSVNKKDLDPMNEDIMAIAESELDGKVDGYQELLTNERFIELYNKSIAKEKNSSHKGIMTTGNAANDLFLFEQTWKLGVSTTKKYYTRQAIKEFICMGDFKKAVTLYSADRLISGTMRLKSREYLIGQ